MKRLIFLLALVLSYSLLSAQVIKGKYQSTKRASGYGADTTAGFYVINPNYDGKAGLGMKVGADSAWIKTDTATVTFESPDSLWKFDGMISTDGLQLLGGTPATGMVPVSDNSGQLSLQFLAQSDTTIYIGFIDSTDINAEPASSSISITLSTSMVPSGYAISGVWLETEEAFVSATRDILPSSPFMQSTSPLHTIISGSDVDSDVVQITGRKLRIISLNEFFNIYLNNLNIIFVFDGLLNNPQDYTAGKVHFWLELKKAPTVP